MPIEICNGIKKGENMFPEAKPAMPNMQKGIAAAGAGNPHESQTRLAQDLADDHLELLRRLPQDATGAEACLARAMRMAEAHTAQTEASESESQP